MSSPPARGSSAPSNAASTSIDLSSPPARGSSANPSANPCTVASSPPARGSSPQPVGPGRGGRVVPARAGVFRDGRHHTFHGLVVPARAGVFRRPAAHPDQRDVVPARAGVFRRPTASVVDDRRSSPPARGSSGRRLVRRHRPAVVPARAGVFPRTATFVSPIAMRSSPPARGSSATRRRRRRSRCCRPRPRGGLPAAPWPGCRPCSRPRPRGGLPIYDGTRPANPSRPRPRGGLPFGEVVWNAFKKSSPPARGWNPVLRGRGDGERVVPACAGVGPTSNATATVLRTSSARSQSRPRRGRWPATLTS